MKRVTLSGAIGFLLLVFLYVPISNARAASIYYATPSGLTTGTCSDWANACTLTYAISIATSGDEIWVAEGIHKPGAARTDYFNLKDGLQIYGGFDGTETLRTQRDPDANLTILSGDVSGDDTTDANGVVTDYTDIDGDDNNYRVVNVALGASSSTVLDGFTITAAYADDDSSYYDGGGIYSGWASPTLNNLHISGNYAYRFGGGIYFYGGSTATVSNSVFIGNGAINIAGSGGGGIYTQFDSLVLTNVDFIRNVGRGSGGIERHGGALTLTNVGFYGNIAYNDGQAMNLINGGPDIMTNVTFVGSSGEYSEVYLNLTDPIITNATFTANSIGLECRQGSPYSEPTLVNSLFYNAYILNCEGYTTLDHTTITYDDPGFVRTASSGSDGTWGTEDDDYGDLNLIPTSTLIDSGNNNATYLSGVTTDLEGKPRFMDVTTIADTGEGTAPIVDRGAFESTGIAPDLIAGVSNNVAGEIAYGDTFTWTVTVTNTGSMTSSLTSGQIILTDNLPSSGATYGTAIVQNTSGITGTVACEIASNTLTCSADGAVVIDDSGGKFDAAFLVTPTTPGTLVNPRSGGSCMVDPNGAIIELNESNNNCSSDTVTVNAPDLVVSKTNNVSGSLTLGETFSWTLTVTNTDLISASFTSAQVLLQDDLPSSGAIYGTPLVQNTNGITGTVSCNIVSNSLTCSADGSVTMGESGSKFDVTIPVTPTVAGALDNPRSGGSCSVDPDSLIVENDETNNDCNSDSVTVNKAASTLSTEIQDSEHNPITSAPIGALVHGQATVTGPTGLITPTGVITLTIYDNPTCTGTPVTAQSQTLTDGVAESDSLPAQSFFYTVDYGGDDNYLTDSHACTLFSAYQPGPAFTVNTTADDEFDYLCSDVHCTLRDAIDAANEMAAENTILFAVGDNQTITLTSALPEVMDEAGALTIDGETHAITISGNYLHPVFDIGSGGIKLTLQNLTVADGLATSGAGIYLGSSSYLTLTQVTVISNTATTYGAGLFMNSASNVDLTNVTFANNQAADYGGAIYNTSGTLLLNNVTMSANASASTGGGIYQTGGSLDVQNSILWNNSTGQIEVSGASPIQIINNVIQGGCPIGGGCINIIDTNPLLAPLGDYGGSTPTLPLLPGSSAIDVIEGDGVCASTDQRGVIRPQNDICDAGAFESQGYSFDDLSGTPQHTPISTAFPDPLVLTVTASAPIEPVSGGLVTFTPPSSDATAIIAASPATISANGAVTVTATANGVAGGPYSVIASASGANSVNFSLTNDKETVTVILSNLNQAYDGTPKAVSAETNPPGFDVDVSYNGSFTAPSNAGIYTVVGTVDHINYQGVATDTLTISTLPISVTAAADSKSYDGTISSTGEPSITTGSLALGDTAVWTQTFDTKDVGTGKTLTPAGTISDGNNGNNYDVTYIPVTTGEISSIGLTVKANDAVKYYADPLPAFTAVYTGFVNNETVDDLSGTLSFTTTATQSSPVGNYDVTPMGVTSGNYDITFQKGTLHIIPMSELELSMSASANPTLAGADLMYTLVATNHGPSNATQITFTDTLPAKASFVSASTGCIENLGIVSCDIDDLASGASFSATITVNLGTSTLGGITNNAALDGFEADADMDNNTASLTVQVLPSLVAYSNNFEIGIGDHWCSNVFTSTTPIGSRRFLGEFNTQENVCLSIPNLTEHTLVTLSFDLFIIRSWDGDFSDGVVGADRWQILAGNGVTSPLSLLNTTFSNFPDFTQSYPGNYPADQYTSLSGADEINSLGYLWGSTIMDSVYNMEFTFDHVGQTLALNFASLGLQDISDESWGLDNIQVILSAGAEFLPNSVYLPVLIR
ncbi:MAG: DUF11 domain-containing protein [Anaerolineales bacterium]|nr:DUF11 domain-containing protein [Anaerolineales bacterium]